MKRAFIILLLFLGIQLGVSALIGMLGGVLLAKGWIAPEGELVTNPLFLSIILCLSNALTIVILFLMGAVCREDLSTGRLRPKDYLFFVLMLLPALFWVNGLTELFQLSDEMAVHFDRLMRHPLGVFSIVLLGPLAEEMVFRAGIQRALLQQGLMPWSAIAVSALLFGIVHGNPAQIPGAILLGMLFGWVYWRTRSLSSAYFMHVLNNLIGVVTWTFWGSDARLIDLTGPWLFGGLMFLSCFLLIVFILLFERHMKNRNKSV